MQSTKNACSKKIVFREVDNNTAKKDSQKDKLHFQTLLDRYNHLKHQKRHLADKKNAEMRGVRDNKENKENKEINKASERKLSIFTL